MIERYQSKQMKDLWSIKNKFKTYLEVEIAACRAFNQLNVIPNEDLEKIINNARFDLETIFKLEKETNHDVVAFTRAVSLNLSEEKKWIHFGLTSTDVVDTSNAVILKKANTLISDALKKLISTIKAKALIYKSTPCIGRTHGIHADITSFGLKWALWYDLLNNALKRFEQARAYVECGKISGAVGNYAFIPPFIEESVCKQLDISKPNISTQVLQRDRHANYLSEIALIGSILEQIATEIRSLQRSEIFEVEEYFKKGQKGSSAMPHKRNPIACENICGCARVLRGYMLTFYENIALWHERDISHSATERIILPDSTSLLEYMINRLNNVLSNLVVYEDTMLKNIFTTNGVIFSQRILQELISKNLSREEAYDIVQPISIMSLNYNKSFLELLLKDEIINKYLSEQEIKNCFTLDYYFKNVEYIYKQVGII